MELYRRFLDTFSTDQGDPFRPLRPMLMGFAALFVGGGSFVAWALMVEIDGAVVATGEVVVESRQQIIQHLDGGVVTGIFVKEGDTVAAGDPILALDDHELLAQQAVALRSYTEILARQDRLRAEIRGDERLDFSRRVDDLSGLVPDFPEILATETALFEIRQTTLGQSGASIREMKRQTEASIEGLEKQLRAASDQRDLVQTELDAQFKLLEGGLARRPEISSLQREAARLFGAIGELEAKLAESRSALSGYDIELLRMKSTFIEDAQDQLQELDPKAVDALKTVDLLRTRIDRLMLRSPVAGSVLNLKISTIGGVIGAGQEIATVVPSDVPLEITGRVQPTEVDRIRVGQRAIVRFPNFDLRTTPEFPGIVSTISADSLRDPTTGSPYFSIGIALDAAPATINLPSRIAPGMPAEIFIGTDKRTPASYITKPIADYWAYAMREE